MKMVRGLGIWDGGFGIEDCRSGFDVLDFMTFDDTLYVPNAHRAHFAELL
jgi:hypothetical protein